VTSAAPNIHSYDKIKGKVLQTSTASGRHKAKATGKTSKKLYLRAKRDGKDMQAILIW
jgi:hypothetical protein